MLATLIITQLQFREKACEIESLCKIVTSFQMASAGKAEEDSEHQPRLPYEIQAFTKDGDEFWMRLESESRPDGTSQMILRLIFDETI